MTTPQEERRIGETLRRLGTGDGAAREELIAWASERMREIAHRMLRTFPSVRRWEETDDVVQNAALRLDRALRQTVPDDARGLVGLAATQVRRELLDLAKKHRGPESYGANHETNYQRIDGELRAKVEEAAVSGEAADTLERWTFLGRRLAGRGTRGLPHVLVPRAQAGGNRQLAGLLRADRQTPVGSGEGKTCGSHARRKAGVSEQAKVLSENVAPRSAVTRHALCWSPDPTRRSTPQ